MTLVNLCIVRDEWHDYQTVVLSQDLWSSIAHDSKSEATDKDTSMVVSISIPALTASIPLPHSHAQHCPASFLAFASSRPSLELPNKQGNTLFVCAQLLQDIFGPNTLATLDDDSEEPHGTEGNVEHSIHVANISYANPIQLDELVLGALDAGSYQFARENQKVIAAELAKNTTLLRTFCRYSINQHSFRVLMANPVQQGVVHPEKTNIMIVDATPSAIDEVEKSTDDLSHIEASLSMLSPSNGSDTVKPKEFHPVLLRQPWPVQRIFPVPNKADDNENRVFVDLKYLATCEIFSGDWVLLSGANHHKARLCRVYAIDIPDNQDGLDMYMPPSLYFNLGLPTPVSADDRVVVQATRLAHPPESGPPRASELTVAHVASPTTMDKSLRPYLVKALRQWFEGKERVVCQDDIIAVSVDEETARLWPVDDDNDDESTLAGKHISLASPSALAFFKVTDLKTDTAAMDGNVHPAYYGAGRKVVPSLTEVTNVGVEHSRIPVGFLSTYYQLTEQLPFHRSGTSTYLQLFDLFSSTLHPMAREVELSCTALLHGSRGCGKSTVVRELCEEFGIHVYEFSVYDIIAETEAKTEVYLRAKFEKAAALAPCVILLRDVQGLGQKSVVIETGQEPLMATVLQDCIKTVGMHHVQTGFPVIVVATTNDVEQLPASFLSCFRYEIAVGAPDENTRLQILKSLTQQCPIAPDASLESLATQTAALVPKDLVDLVRRAGIVALQRIQRAILPSKETNETDESNSRQTLTVHDIAAAGISLTAADFDTALNEVRASYSDSIGAPKIPNVTWDDVGGLGNVKSDILDTIQLPLEHPELFGAGLKKRSGILLYGPPGTGKTLLAKAIATSCSLNFFSVKGPELLNMYIGESEANVRRVFHRARDAKPCVIFFDELDSVAPKRGEKGDSGGVMDRIVSQLLAELDGMSEGSDSSGGGDVFVIGATNRPDLLDPALLRPGRFDKLLYLGVSQDHESQLKIIQALTRKFRLDPDLDLARVAERCPFHYTGADFYALCTDAMLKAMMRVAETIDKKVAALNEEKRPDLPAHVTPQYFLSRLATPEDTTVQVEEVDFVRALDELIPSVSAAELEHYMRVRDKFEQRKENDTESL